MGFRLQGLVDEVGTIEKVAEGRRHTRGDLLLRMMDEDRILFTVPFEGEEYGARGLGTLSQWFCSSMEWSILVRVTGKFLDEDNAVRKIGHIVLTYGGEMRQVVKSSGELGGGRLHVDWEGR